MSDSGGTTSTSGSVGAAGIQQVWAGAGRKVHVDPAASKPHEYSGKFEGWRNAHEPCLHCGQPKESDVHRPSYSDEPQEMTDVMGPRPARSVGHSARLYSGIFKDRRALGRAVRDL